MAELRRTAQKVMVEAETFDLELSADDVGAFRTDPEAFMRQLLRDEGYEPRSVSLGNLLDNLGDGAMVTRWEHLITPGWFCHWMPRETDTV